MWSSLELVATAFQYFWENFGRDDSVISWPDHAFGGLKNLIGVGCLIRYRANSIDTFSGDDFLPKFRLSKEGI
jgi:hypothetical protein